MILTPEFSEYLHYPKIVHFDISLHLKIASRKSELVGSYLFSFEFQIVFVAVQSIICDKIKVQCVYMY